MDDYLAAYDALIDRLIGRATVERTSAAAIEALRPFTGQVRPLRRARG